MKRPRAESPAAPPAELTLPVRQHRQYSRERWAAAFAAVFLAISLLLTNALTPIEDGLVETRARLLDRAPTGDLAIVEIDAKSIAALESWPWSRQLHADIINRLHAAGAAMIAFDVDFSARADRSGDRAFAEALRSAQPVILPIFAQRASDSSEDPALVNNRPASGFDAAWIGGVNILPDHDGIVREFPAATMIGGRIQPSIAVLLAENDRLGDRTFQPDWSIDATRIPRISFIDLLRGRVSRRLIEGKRVIVGATAVELGDRYTIPRFGTVPGVVVQALATESLLQHRAISRSGWLCTAVGLTVIFLMLGIGYRSRRRFGLLAASTLVVLLAGPTLLQARSPVSVDTAPLIVAAVVGIALRIIVEARLRNRMRSLEDAESGLPNSRALEARLAEQPDAAITLVAASIDRFETIRAAVGSGAVAELACQTAERLCAAAGAEIFRVAPDTFAWISDQETDTQALVRAATDLFLPPISTGRGPVDVVLTFGFANATSSAGRECLVEQSIAAINAARSKGARSQWFSGIAAETVDDLSIIGKLRRGIIDGDVTVAFQPKLDLRTGAVTHAEALVRWRHPVEGFISPDRFVPLAEQTGAVRDLTRFVLSEVLAYCSQPDGVASDIGVSVNVSAADIADPGFADEMISALAQSSMDPARLTLEITERAIIGSHETALKVLQELRRRLVQLSIDDYGTGQSTLTYLKTFPVDELKIDKAFVTSLCHNAGDRIMVRSTIGMAHELGLRVVAEGVEDWETVKLLRELGCDEAQGYCIGKAMSFEALCSMAQAGSFLRKVA